MKKRKIIVIDDELYILQALKIILDKVGADIYCFSNVEKALSMLAEETFDLIISDFNLKQKINGIDLIAKVKNVQPTIKAIIISGSDLSAHNKQLTILDVTVINKPIDDIDIFMGLVKRIF